MELSKRTSTLQHVPRALKAPTPVKLPQIKLGHLKQGTKSIGLGHTHELWRRKPNRTAHNTVPKNI